jgi:peptidoglycan hydrolase-like protein with peptidoglycan-binding domain
MTIDVDLAQAASSAGFSGDDLVTAVAIGLAEGGQVGKCNFDVNGDSCGPWQIHFKDPATTRIIQGHTYTKEEAATLDGCARAAHGLYLNRGRGFQDWSTFNSGRFEQFLSRATSAVAQLGLAPLRSAAIPPFPGRNFVWPRTPMMRGEDIRQWQGQAGEITADGLYGPKSKERAKAIQHAHDLAEDGIVGPKTWTATFGD